MNDRDCDNCRMASDVSEMKGDVKELLTSNTEIGHLREDFNRLLKKNDDEHTEMFTRLRSIESEELPKRVSKKEVALSFVMLGGGVSLFELVLHLLRR